MKYELKLGDNAETLKQYPDNYFDSIVTDPPYGIEFLGKDWDKNTGVMETWHECYRVLKPGGHILAFSAARTYHNLATNIELAGFEIRDQLMWLYGSGFPKAQDIGKAIQKRQGVDEYEKFVDTTENRGFGMTDHARVRAGVEWSTKADKVGSPKCTSEEAQQWAGWKTALKPAHEPIVMARKPFKGSCIDNVLKHGTGALNIDESRIKVADDELKSFQKEWDRESRGKMEYLKLDGKDPDYVAGSVREYVPEGRYPANVIGEVPEYQKYFYCPKVSRAERHIGFEQKPEPYDRREEGLESAGIQGLQKLAGKKTFGEATQTGGLGRMIDWKEKHAGKKNLDHIHNGGHTLGYSQSQWKDNSTSQSLGNNHPTVKPVELMKYLVKLVTPKGGKVLDPFNGSGSTGMACVELDYEYTGCELDPEYIEIATKRIEGWYEHTRPETNYDDLFDE